MATGDLLLHDVIHAAAERTPQRPAVSYRERVLTFAEVATLTDRLAAGLLAHGVRPGARVAWWGATTPDVVALYFAIAQSGAVFVPLNPRYSAAEGAATLDLAEPDLVVTDAAHPGDVDLAELLTSPLHDVPAPQVSERDAVAIFPTSGTTGIPKGVVLSHRAVRLRLMTYSPGAGPTSTIFPPFHWGGWGAYQAALAGGTESAMVDGGDTEALLATLERRRVSRFYAIPAVWRRILASDLGRYDLQALREANTGTSATPPQLLQAIAKALPGTTTSVGYGSTESGGISALGPADLDRKPGSVGLPTPGLRTRIDGDGVLWVSCPHLFDGYWRNPEATEAVLRDGWYCTGDLVERDDEGYLWVVGRARDIIRTGGETVAPAEVDAVVQGHPAVADAAVAGLPDEDWGEVVAAFVVLRPGAALDLDALRRHCAGTLASFKHPRRLVVVDHIPRTGPTGQVQRAALARLAEVAES